MQLLWWRIFFNYPDEIKNKFQMIFFQLVTSVLLDMFLSDQEWFIILHDYYYIVYLSNIILVEHAGSGIRDAAPLDSTGPPFRVGGGGWLLPLGELAAPPPSSRPGPAGALGGGGN